MSQLYAARRQGFSILVLLLCHLCKPAETPKAHGNLAIDNEKRHVDERYATLASTTGMNDTAIILWVWLFPRRQSSSRLTWVVPWRLPRDIWPDNQGRDTVKWLYAWRQGWSVHRRTPCIWVIWLRPVSMWKFSTHARYLRLQANGWTQQEWAFHVRDRREIWRSHAREFAFEGL